jgi:hypothetical protein
MPSGAVYFDAVLGNFPRWLIMDVLVEHTKVQVCDLKLKNS